MVVTNLFQTPTLCESVYQQVQFGKLRSGPIWIAWGIAILCGVALAAGVFRYGFKARHRSRTVSTKMPHVRIPALHRWGLACLSWVVLGICCIVPWLSLISRMGLRSTALEGRFVRVWSIADCGSALWHVQDFREEFGWSFQLSLWSVGLSFALGGMLIWMTSRSVRPAWVFGVLGCMLVTPGPLINLVVGQLLNRWLPSSFGFLSDRTLLGPILGLQFRVLPVVFGLLWTMRQQYIERYGDLLQLENQLPVKNRWYASIRYTQWGWVIAFLVGFSIAFGDLASYLLVQPPGVTTVAMRMFDLLHYGTKNREAGLAVVLACLGAASSLAIVRAVPQRR
jgi:ABC-type Fe3+ transport system permease subunit